ncbi:uncharacterized protein LOC144042748 [Vanacampus margaritifer]
MDDIHSQPHEKANMDTRVLVLLLCVQLLLLSASQSTHAASNARPPSRSEIRRTSRRLERKNRHSNCSGRPGACGARGQTASEREETLRRLEMKNRHSNCSGRPGACGLPGQMEAPPTPPPRPLPKAIACFAGR